MDENEAIQWINCAVSEIKLLDKETAKGILEQCGRMCARNHELPQEAAKIRDGVEDQNDIDTLFQRYKKEIYDESPRLTKDGDVIYLEYHKCGCPHVATGEVKDPFFCNCTRGYTKETYEALFGRLVRVTLLSSILWGDEICKQEIQIL